MQLILPPFVPPANSGNKRLSLAYVCQRLSDGSYLDAKTSTWGSTPVLGMMRERGKTEDGNILPGDVGALRGTYVPSDPLDSFGDIMDILGQFFITYHDRNSNNLVIDSLIFISINIQSLIGQNPPPTQYAVNRKVMDFQRTSTP